MPDRREWAPVAYWETMRTLKRKDFLISVLLMPVLIVGIAAAVAWFRERSEKRVHRIAVVSADSSGALAAATLEPFETFEWVAPEERTIEDLKAAVDQRRYDGAALLPGAGAREEDVRLLVRRSAPSWRPRLEEHLRARARIERAAGFGLDAEALGRIDAPLEVTEVVTRPEGRVSRADRGAAAILMVLLVMVLFVTASYMSIGITGEKQARVTEVIVSAIRPQSWIDGKIVAYTAIGLAQAGLWGVAGLVVVLLFRFPLPLGLSPGMLAVCGLVFLLGLMLYIALYALIMATIKDLQSTTKFQAYLFFLPFIPLMMVQSAVRSPDAPWAIITSQVPFFSPFLIPARLTVSGVMWWEIVLAVALLVVAFHYLRRAAGAAFRIGMLMYGKELTLPELARWAKEV